MKRILCLCAAVAVAWPFVARAEAPAACTCPSASTGQALKDLARYRSAFAGRVTQSDGGRVTFEVLRVYKGPRAKTLTLSSGAGGCAFGFENGKAYLVYANGDKQALATDRCAPNRPLGEAQAELRQLDLHTGQAASPLRGQ